MSDPDANEELPPEEDEGAETLPDTDADVPDFLIERIVQEGIEPGKATRVAQIVAFSGPMPPPWIVGGFEADGKTR